MAKYKACWTIFVKKNCPIDVCIEFDADNPDDAAYKAINKIRKNIGVMLKSMKFWRIEEVSS